MKPIHPVKVRRLPTGDLTPAEVAAIRRLLDAAFGEDPEHGFAEEDWEHATGGVHFLAERGDQVVGHASVVRRELRIGGRSLRTGYVEAVATVPQVQGQGVGTAVMREVGPYIAAEFELGALGTGSQGFYERLGWTTWRGPSSVRTESGERPTPEDDGYIMVLRTPSTPPLDLDAPISCEWRPGDVW